MHLGSIFYLLGWLTASFGGFMLLPAAMAAGFNDVADATIFTTCAGVTVFLGCLLILMFKPRKLYLNHKDGVLITALAWATLSFLGAIPLYFTGATPSVVDALFEATSGFTTTGATVMSGLETFPHGVLFWRCLLQWLGGMGIVVFAIAVLPFIGVGGIQLYQRELPGVNKDKLQPRLQETARMLWSVYSSLTIACTVAYAVMGMTWFDAICHAMTTVATAGFSNYDASFEAFNSKSIELVAILFMLLSSISFTAHLRFLQRWDTRIYANDNELRTLITILCGAIAIVALQLTLEGKDFAESLRVALFNVTSLLTTTGYSTTDFALWPPGLMIVLLLLFFAGGCSGSTSGGIKILRVMLITKQSGRELRRLLHPHGVERVKFNGYPISLQVMQGVWAFAGLFVMSFLLIAMILGLMGLDLVTAFAAAAACITNVGPGFGGVGPTIGYGHLTDPMKLILCFAMLLGRLELLTLIVLFLPAFWRK